jgi:hypothetical protein
MKHRKLLAPFMSVLLLVSLLAGCAAAPGGSTTEATTLPPETTRSAETTAATEAAQPPETTAATEATVDYSVFCGRFSNTDTVEGPCYTVNITGVDNETKTVELTVCFVGRNASPIYETDPISAHIADDHAAWFEWLDSWGNRGEGTLVLDPVDPQIVRVLMNVTEEAELNRGTLSTRGEYMTLNRR